MCGAICVKSRTTLTEAASANASPPPSRGITPQDIL